jgi:hypothetical protein
MFSNHLQNLKFSWNLKKNEKKNLYKKRDQVRITHTEVNPLIHSQLSSTKAKQPNTKDDNEKHTGRIKSVIIQRQKQNEIKDQHSLSTFFHSYSKSKKEKKKAWLQVLSSIHLSQKEKETRRKN